MFVQKNMILIQIIIRKIIPRNDDLCLTFYVNKMKYSKSLQRQRTKGEIKKQFKFCCNPLYICAQKRNLNLHLLPFLTTRHRKVTTFSKITAYVYLLFFVYIFR